MHNGAFLLDVNKRSQFSNVIVFGLTCENPPNISLKLFGVPLSGITKEKSGDKPIIVYVPLFILLSLVQ